MLSYNKGEQIGKFDIAYEKIFANKEMTCELITGLLDTYTEEYVKGLLRDFILAKHIPNIQTMIEGALDDMREAWYFKKPGDIYEMGDFAFEDWEGEE